MSEDHDIQTRTGTAEDAPAINEIYNHYVANSPATFDLEPRGDGAARLWIQTFAPRGPHRLIVAEKSGRLIGWASTSRFRDKPAYDRTVEASVYAAPDVHGGGVGGRLYRALFQALDGEKLNRVVAGIVLPNSPSVVLHERCGFREVGVFTEVGFKFGRYWNLLFMERPL